MSSTFASFRHAEVHPGLRIGPVPQDEHDLRVLLDLGVDRVMNLLGDDEYVAGSRMRIEAALNQQRFIEMRAAIVDREGISLPSLELAIAQVQSWLENEHRVYIHCLGGLQRSATLATAVISLRERVGIDDAIERLHQRRPDADPQDALRIWWQRRGRGAR